MAVTKILARKARLDVGIRYVLNGDKTDDRILTARLNCREGQEYHDMMQTKREIGKTDGTQFYHIIQSFQPGEISPEEALDIAQEFANEYLSEYEVVIGTHVDKHHIHSHILFNSVSTYTGKRYHSTRASYRQIREISDRLCREHGLSVIEKPEHGTDKSYAEWRREKLGLPTYRSMLEGDLEDCIQSGMDFGGFLMLMENLGYEVKHKGDLVGFRLRGQEQFCYPGRGNRRYTETGIRNALVGIEEQYRLGVKVPTMYVPQYRPFLPRFKATGIVALYYHYLHLLGENSKRRYSVRPYAHMRREIMKFERYKRHAEFLHGHDLTDMGKVKDFMVEKEDELTALVKRRTIANVAKKKRMPLYQALADESALEPLCDPQRGDVTPPEDERRRYLAAKALLDGCGVSREQLAQERAEVYGKIADLNREMREVRKEIRVCREILETVDQVGQFVKEMERLEKTKKKEQWQEF